MTSVSDWFAQRMGARPQQAPQQPQQYYPQPQQYQQPVVQQQVPQQPFVPTMVALASQSEIPKTALMEMVRSGDITLKQASSFWKGNPKGATGREDQLCPQCNGPRYFQRQNTKLRRDDGVAVAPSSICWDCGYNDLFELQYGVTGEPGGHVSA